ncbi:MAG: hypothetical protein JNM56_15375 [Planctomycetia bacterium]|nr:hypothetical protein [Planctomycetia bacterium]
MNPLLAMFHINVSWLTLLIGFLVVYFTLRRKSRPTARDEEIPTVLPADAPGSYRNPLRNPRFERKPALGVLALTLGGAAVLFCLLLISVVFLGASRQASFVSYGGPLQPEQAVEQQLLALERMQQAEQVRLQQQRRIAAPVLEPLPAPRPEPAPQQPEIVAEVRPAPKQVVAAVPLPQPLQPPQPPKGKTINPTRTSAARTQVITVEGEYQKTREAAWRAALEQAESDVQDYLRQRGMRLETRVPRELIEHKMLKGEPREETRDFGGNVGEVRRFVLEIQVTPEVRALLAQQEREFRAQERMFLVGKVLALIVVLLAATALYFRLDEYTKGYYTSSLRWAALGVVAGFIVFLIFGS